MKTKYVIKITSQFKRDYRKAQKRGLPTELLKEILGLLAMGEPLPAKNKDHMLTGIWAGYHECHVQPNWLLIYLIEPDPDIDQNWDPQRFVWLAEMNL